MLTQSGDGCTSVTISFMPCTQAVRGISRMIMDFCRMSLDDGDIGARVHMAAYELVENIVKYGSPVSADLRIELERERTTTIVRVKTRNTAPPGPMERAVQVLSDVREAADPLAYYDKRVLETLPKSGDSGLGLARIRAEGDLAIDFQVDGSELSIVAKGEFAKRGEA